MTHFSQAASLLARRIGTFLNKLRLRVLELRTHAGEIAVMVEENPRVHDHEIIDASGPLNELSVRKLVKEREFDTAIIGDKGETVRTLFMRLK